MSSARTLGDLRCGPNTSYTSDGATRFNPGIWPATRSNPAASTAASAAVIGTERHELRDLTRGPTGNRKQRAGAGPRLPSVIHSLGITRLLLTNNPTTRHLVGTQP
jgi:hypothetical protein